MGKKALATGAALIALYLIVKNSGGFNTAATGSAKGTANIVKAFQGR